MEKNGMASESAFKTGLNTGMVQWIRASEGLACFLLLVPAQLWSPSLIRAIEPGTPNTFVVMYAAEGLTLLVAVLVFKYQGKETSVRKSSWLIATLFGLAPLIAAFANTFPNAAAPYFLLVVAALAASARMWFYLKSIAVFGRLGVQQGLAWALASFLVAIVLRIPIEAMPASWTLPLAAALPFLFLAMLGKALTLVDERGLAAKISDEHSSLNAKAALPFVLETILFGVVMGLFRLNAGIWQSHPTVNLLSLAVKIVVLLLMLISLFRYKGFTHVNTQFLIALAFVIAATTLTSVSFSGWGDYISATMFIDLARYSTGICLFLISIILARRHHTRTATMLCLLWAPYALSFCISYAIGNAVDISRFYAESLLVNAILLVLAAVFLILNIISSSEERLFSTGGISAQHIEQFDYINNRCKEIGDEEHLTPREIEIMQLICKGRSKRYIAEHFVISENTVRWHAKNLYAKMGVTSRQELLDRIEENQDEL